MTHKVIWSEGMFLKPHHFQQQDHYFENLINQKTNVLTDNNWGFSELNFSPESLSLGKITLSSCRGIFPDGTVFNVPHNDIPPKALDLPAGVNDKIIYLAIPSQSAGQPEITLDENNFSYRYHVQDKEIIDSVANSCNSNHLTQIQVGQLSLRLMLDSEDKSNFSCLAALHIKEVRPNKQITVNKNFIPPCINVLTTPILKNFITETHGLLQHRAEMLSYRLTDTQQSATAEIADFMLLQIVNRFEPLFHYLCNIKQLHPEDLYQYLLQLLGEISTFTNDKRRPPQPPVYQHHNLESTFNPVFEALRQSLSMVLEQNSVAITLQQHEYGLWTGNIADKELLHSANFILAVYADVASETIRNVFPNQVKIAPTKQIRNLISRAIPGISLQPLPVAPRQIPYHANFSYFLLEKNHNFWQALENSPNIAFHIGSNFPGLKLELWAIRG